LGVSPAAEAMLTSRASLLKRLVPVALIPADWHEPLLQRMALLRDAGPVAEAFYDFIQQPAAREIMTRYGFTLPD